jgi:hypothetical protein
VHSWRTLRKSVDLCPGIQLRSKLRVRRWWLTSERRPINHERAGGNSNLVVGDFRNRQCLLVQTFWQHLWMAIDAIVKIPDKSLSTGFIPIHHCRRWNGYLICDPLCVVTPETYRCLLREEFGTEEPVNAAPDDEDDRESEPGERGHGWWGGSSWRVSGVTAHRGSKIRYPFHLLQWWIGINPVDRDLSGIFISALSLLFNLLLPNQGIASNFAFWLSNGNWMNPQIWFLWFGFLFQLSDLLFISSYLTIKVLVNCENDWIWGVSELCLLLTKVMTLFPV